jgi:cold shock CspA family protein
VYTVPEQRKRAAQGQNVDAPAFCKECRGADVRLAEAEAAVPVERDETQAATAAVDAAPQVQPKSRERSSSRSKSASGGGRRGKGGKSRGRSRKRGASRQKPRPRQTEIRVRHFGTVKWFDETRGFGFIAEDNGDELFVHSSGVLTGGNPALEQGDSVEYEVEHTDRGLQAVDVVPLA